ncbi:hypothetical protein NC651_014774 [Populus alba x Populus x berolinensis]|nr:hypothetical protein NC651_014774 [Populus alba x Populus x berolinensis]
MFPWYCCLCFLYQLSIQVGRVLNLQLFITCAIKGSAAARLKSNNYLWTVCLEEKALKGFWLQVPWCCATLPPCFSFLHHLLLQTTRLDFNQSLKAPGPTSHSFWTTNT